MHWSFTISFDICIPPRLYKPDLIFSETTECHQTRQSSIGIRNGSKSVRELLGGDVEQGAAACAHADVPRDPVLQRRGRRQEARRGLSARGPAHRAQ